MIELVFLIICIHVQISGHKDELKRIFLIIIKPQPNWTVTNKRSTPLNQSMFITFCHDPCLISERMRWLTPSLTSLLHSVSMVTLIFKVVT